MRYTNTTDEESMWKVLGKKEMNDYYQKINMRRVQHLPKHQIKPVMKEDPGQIQRYREVDRQESILGFNKKFITGQSTKTKSTFFNSQPQEKKIFNPFPSKLREQGREQRWERYCEMLCLDMI